MDPSPSPRIATSVSCPPVDRAIGASMATEPFTLRTRRGASSEATAEVDRTPAATRWARAAGVAVVGTLVGLATIVVPTVHLVSVWAVPLLSWGVAAYTLTLRGKLRSVRGPCPACAVEIELGQQGELTDEVIWALCPKCNEPLKISAGGP